MRLPSLLLTLTVLATLSLISQASAQCTVSSVDFQSYGRGCTTWSNFTPRLTGQFDSMTCNVSLTFSASGGCCGYTMQNRIFLLGARQAQAPAPWMGSAGCFLWVDPILILAVPPSQTTLTANLPRNTRLGTAYIQGVASYSNAAGMLFEASNGLSVTLR